MAKLKSYSKGRLPSKNVVVVAVSAISLVALTALVVGIQTFGLLTPQAASIQPTINRSFADNFKSNNGIDATRWSVTRANDNETLKGRINVTETATENLRIDLPASIATSATSTAYASQGVLSKVGAIETLGDFTMVAAMYRPQVTGDGLGRAGIRFTSNTNKNDGKPNNEGAGIHWSTPADGKKGQLVFYVNNADGERLLTTPLENFDASTALIRLDRKNGTYVAYYKKNTFDGTADKAWQVLGSCADAVVTKTKKACNSGLGQSGILAFYAYNGDVDKKYPKVVAPVDTILLRWEDTRFTPPPAKSFVDAFSDDVISKNWVSKKVNGATLVESKGNNLVVTANSTDRTKLSRVDIRRSLPAIGVIHNFAYNVVAYKPQVTGDGTGVLNVSFVSATDSVGIGDHESASLRWLVTRETKTVAGKKVVQETSKLTFTVTDREDDIVGISESITLTGAEAKAPVLMLRLARTTTGEDIAQRTTYRAWYHVGTDGDNDWKQVGNAVDTRLGSYGHLGLAVSNVGAKINNVAKFPKVVVRIDRVSGTVSDTQQ